MILLGAKQPLKGRVKPKHKNNRQHAPKERTVTAIPFLKKCAQNINTSRATTHHHFRPPCLKAALELVSDRAPAFQGNIRNSRRIREWSPEKIMWWYEKCHELPLPAHSACVPLPLHTSQLWLSTPAHIQHKSMLRVTALKWEVFLWEETSEFLFLFFL